jgi:hypothetical protein
MKPILLCLALLPAMAHGQWEVSVFGGAGLGRLPTDLMPVTSRGEFQKVLFGPSWSAGLQVRHAISGPLHFTTGIHWTCISGRDEYWLRGAMYRSAERRLGYVSLPMLVGFDAWRMQLGGGFQFGYLAAQQGRFTQELPFVYGPSATETGELGLRSIDIGLAARLSITIAERLKAGLWYYRGLADIKDHSDGHLSPLWTEQVVGMVAYRIVPKGRRSKQESPTAPVPDPAD